MKQKHGNNVILKRPIFKVYYPQSERYLESRFHINFSSASIALLLQSFSKLKIEHLPVMISLSHVMETIAELLIPDVANASA